jgi:hypothetical protein
VLGGGERAVVLAGLAFGDEQGSHSFDTSGLLPLFCGFAAGAEAIASVAERLAPISKIETAGSRTGYLRA